MAGVAPRGRSNPLALAILACLFERPMHPYEVAQTLRSRAKHESVRLNYGSLYGVVEALEQRGLVTARETVREGRRPERTVYEITPTGERELFDWLSELVAAPVKEYPQFEAALSFLAVLSPDEAADLLDQRATALDVVLGQLRGAHATTEQMGLPRLFELESEYRERVLEAELAWVRSLVADIRAGVLEGQDSWAGFHAARPPNARSDDGREARSDAAPDGL
jgi:DNA-binding PadR family transcriptional regulator